MADLENLDGVNGGELSLGQIHGILQQIDLDIMNLLRDGKLSAARYRLDGAPAPTMDRAACLQALLDARDRYQTLLNQQSSWQVSTAEVCNDE